MSWLKRLVRRSATLRKLAGQLRFLREEVRFAGLARLAPKKFMDRSHLQRSWDFESPAAREWHDRVLTVIATAVGGERWGDAIEIGCSEGVFTSYLAARCRFVDAFDISPVAQVRAVERCARYANVRIGLLDLVKDEAHGKYDLVFAMDILSCIRGRRRLTKAVMKLTNLLRDGGVLIYTDNSMPLDVLRTTGGRPWWGSFLAMMEPDDCVRFLESRFALQLVYRERYHQNIAGGRDQLIALFRKDSAHTQGASAELLEEPVPGDASHAEFVR